MQTIAKIPFIPDEKFPLNQTNQVDFLLKLTGMEGSHQVSGNLNSKVAPSATNRPANPPAFTGNLTIVGTAPKGRWQVTWQANNGLVEVQRERFAFFSWLRNLHFRAGYSNAIQASLQSRLWSIMVDVTMLMMLFWVISGVWMWLRKATHRLTVGLGLLVAFGIFCYVALHL